MSGPIDDFVGAILERRKNIPSGEGDKEFFVTEIRLLKEKLTATERRCEELTASNEALGAQLKSHKVDQDDIFEYLNGELTKKTDEIVRLEEDVQILEDNNASLAREYEQKLTDKDDAFAQQKDDLEKQIGDLSEALEDVHEFQVRKEELEREHAETKAALEDEKAEHTRHVAELERKHVQEKDRLKKEMLVKLRETKATLHKMTANQLDTTTKRTIAENEQISSELAWQSREAERLIKRHDRLTDENRTLKRELSLHKQTEDEFARKVHVYQKTIKTLLAKLNSMDLAKRSEMETLTHAEEEIERARALAQSQIDNLESEMDRLRSENGTTGEEVERLRAELGRAHTLAEQREAQVDDGMRFLMTCLEDLRAHMPVPPPPEGAPASDVARALASVDFLGDGGAGSGEDGTRALPGLADISAPEQRETVLQGLLERLSAYQKQVAELSLHKEWRQIQKNALGQRREGHGGVPLPPIGLPNSAVAHGATLPEGEVAPGVPMLMPDPFAFGPGLAVAPGRPAAKEKGAAAAAVEVGGAVKASASAADAGGVTGPVRPWGKRSKDLPLTRHSPGAVRYASTSAT